MISWRIDLRPKEYFAFLLVLETSVFGVFMSLDLLLFFLFFELELLPMFLLISIWGSGERRHYSALKFVLYTIFGSAFMLVGFLVLGVAADSFDFRDIRDSDLANTVIPLQIVFAFILLAFSVKLPVVPLHPWLPDAHTDAPTAVSVLLAGVLLKMGGYGIIRLVFTLMPDVAADANVNVDANLILTKWITIRGVHNYHPRHLVEALDFVYRNRGVFPFNELVNGRFSLDDLDTAFKQAAERQVLRAAIVP